MVSESASSCGSGKLCPGPCLTDGAPFLELFQLAEHNLSGVERCHCMLLLELCCSPCWSPPLELPAGRVATFLCARLPLELCYSPSRAQGYLSVSDKCRLFAHFVGLPLPVALLL